jgi:predicted  nucleic acid-binding Zn-ribbon protein
MASNSEISLQAAVSAVEKAFAKLDAAAKVTVHERTQSAATREAAQVELTQTWQAHAAQIEAALAGVTSENEFLKEDNLRLANQLQQLQRDYLDLQKATEHAVGRLDNTVQQLDMILEH